MSFIKSLIAIFRAPKELPRFDIETGKILPPVPKDRVTK